MPIATERLSGHPRREQSSTGSGLPFFQQQQSVNSSLPRSQTPVRPVKGVHGTAAIARVAGYAASEPSLEVSVHPTDAGMVRISTYAIEQSTTTTEELDWSTASSPASNSVRPRLIVARYSQPPEGRHAVFLSVASKAIWETLNRVPSPADLTKAVFNFLRSGQYDRARALGELIDLSLRTAIPLGLESSLGLILAAGTHGCLTAAIEFLKSLGPPYVKQLSLSDRQLNGPRGYSLVRALGLLGERDDVLRFRHVPDESVREAVVEALDDIGDAQSLQALRTIRDEDGSDFIRQLAVEALKEH
jgi:hypothetical protein